MSPIHRASRNSGTGAIQDDGPTGNRKMMERNCPETDALFRTVWDNAGDLIFVVNYPELRIEKANPTFESLGFSCSQLTGQDALVIVYPDDRPLIREAIAEMAHSGSDSNIVQVRYVDSHGHPHHVEAHGCAVRSHQNEIERFVVVARLVEDRFIAQKKLKEREQQLELLLDSTAEGIYGTDTDGRCTFCNKSCLKMLGYESVTQVLGKDMRRLIHPGMETEAENPRYESFHEITRPDPIHVDNEVFTRCDRTLFPVEYWSYPMWNEEKIVGRVVAFVDIAERKAAEDRLHEAHREAELFINAVPSILISLDAKGCIQRWNSAASRIFGLSPIEVIGKPLSSCGIKWLDLPTHFPAALLDESKAPSTLDGIAFEQNGTRRILGLNAKWITIRQSGRGELLVVGADITDRKRAQDELGWKTAFLEAQVRASIDGILVVDEEGKVVLQNERFSDLFCIPPLIQKSKEDYVLLQHVQDQVEHAEEFMEKVQYLYLHREETSRDEIKLKNGTVLDRYSSPVFGKDGEYYGRIWTFRDITQRKKNEDALRQLSVAVEQSPVSVVITDLNGNITYVNRRFTECTGYSYEEVIGKNPRILKSDYTPQQEYNQLWEAITNGKEWRGELRNKKKNGDLYWESVVISPIRNSEGRTSHFLAVKEDITEQKFNETHSRQAQKLEAIGQLSAGIAHEINTPIQFVGDNTRFVKESWTSLDAVISLLQTWSEPKAAPDVLGKVQQLLRDCDAVYLKTEVPKALDQSLEGISRVAKIVQAMKEFSHPGSDEKQLADINKAILTTLTVARNEWKYVADVETFLASDMELVPCHVSELNQVILNLLINSAHAIGEVVTDASRGKGTITIRTTQDKNNTTISIADTGHGILPSIQSKVFDPFFTTKSVGRGTGQGLSLAYNSIVKKHGGKIWFETEVGKGTTFFVQLPTTSRTN